MGITNSCAKLGTCFGWKKSKIIGKRKREISESIVKLREDGSVGIEGLPMARIIPKPRQLWDNIFTRNEGKGNFKPTVSHSLEPISVPSEDRFVKLPMDRQMEGHHFNISLLSSLPPPIPPRKMDRYVCSTTSSEQISPSDVTTNSSTEVSAPSEDLSYGQGRETQRNSPNICLHSKHSAKWDAPPIPLRTFERIANMKSEIAG